MGSARGHERAGSRGMGGGAVREMSRGFVLPAHELQSQIVTGFRCQFGEFRLHGGSHQGVPSRGGTRSDPVLVCSISVLDTWGLSLHLPFPCPPHLLHQSLHF